MRHTQARGRLVRAKQNTQGETVPGKANQPVLYGEGGKNTGAHYLGTSSRYIGRERVLTSIDANGVGGVVARTNRNRLDRQGHLDGRRSKSHGRGGPAATQRRTTRGGAERP